MIEVLQEISATTETLGPEYTGMTANLAARMIVFDAAQDDRRTFTIACAELEDPLLNLDTETLLNDQSSEIAYSALGLYFMRKKLQEVDAKIAALRLLTDLVAPSDIIGQKVRVTSLNPERNKLGTSKQNRYGQLSGQSKYYAERVGTVTKLNLGVEYGGWLQIAGRFGAIHTASPLIDRWTGYKPTFEIEQL